MRVQPVDKVKKIEFCEAHNPIWAANAVAIGTTSAAVTDLTTKTTAARAAFNAQKTALDAAKAATNTYDMAVRAMSQAAQDIVTQVRLKASTAGDSVYSLAQIPPPATPTPATPPGLPYDFKVEVGNNGTLNLKWKNKNAQNCVYMIYRRLGATGEFVGIGGVGQKKYSDTTVPAGTAQVQYKIQAVRSTGQSDFANYIVNLGNEPGAPSVTVTEVTTMRAAA